MAKHRAKGNGKGQFTKGNKLGGRPKGTPNKVTMDVRRVIALIAERRAPQLESWLVRIAKKHPERAADLFLRMIEYHIPKLMRTEMTGPNGGALAPPTIHVHFPGLGSPAVKTITVDAEKALPAPPGSQGSVRARGAAG